MAKFQWTGAGETTGNAPALFSNVWEGTLSEWEVQSHASAETEGKVLAFVNQSGSPARRSLQLDAPGSAVSGRVDARGRFWKAPTGSSLHFVRTHISEQTGDSFSFYADYNGATGWRVCEYGPDFQMLSESAEEWPSGWYRFRFLVDTSNTSAPHQLWVWPDGGAEPSTPTVTTTSHTALSDGGLGFGLYTPQEAYLDWITFGTDGDDADNLAGSTPSPDPSFSIDQSEITPGSTVTGVLSNFADPPTGVRLTDSKGNSISSSSEITDFTVDPAVETFSFTMIDVPGTGSTKTAILFDENLTVELIP